MTREKELEVVTTAYFLEKNLAQLQEDEENILELCPETPEEPKLSEIVIIKPDYPEIDTSKVVVPKIWKILIWVGIILILMPVFLISKVDDFPMIVSFFGIMFYGGIGLIVFSCIKKKKEKKRLIEKYIEEVKKSPEYISKCREIDETYERDCKNLEKSKQEKYQNDLKEYEKYKKEYENSLYPQWVKEANALDLSLADTKKALDKVYQTNIIPGKYRNLSALTFLSSFLGTSNYDLRFAIERYDKEVDQIIARKNCEYSAALTDLTQQVLREQQYTNYLNEQYVSIAEQGNKTLESISDWQKADLAIREYRRIKSRRNARKNR